MQERSFFSARQRFSLGWAQVVKKANPATKIYAKLNEDCVKENSLLESVFGRSVLARNSPHKYA